MMDEPTNGLDIPSKGLFRRLVAEALEEERLFVIATHQVRDVEALVDRLLVLHDGKVLFRGGVSELSSSIRISLDARRPGDREKGLQQFPPGPKSLAKPSGSDARTTGIGSKSRRGAAPRGASGNC